MGNQHKHRSCCLYRLRDSHQIRANMAGEQDDFEDDQPTNYKAPEKVATEELLNKDADDEALMKWKKKLLEGAPSGGGDGPNVEVLNLKLCVEGREDIVLDLSQSDQALQESKIVVKEGVDYKLKIGFKVNNEIVSGLQFSQNFYKSGIKVPGSSQKFMVGSFGPKAEAQEWRANVAETVPSGMMARGTVTIKSRFSDDDKNIIKQWTWTMKVSKDWKD